MSNLSLTEMAAAIEAGNGAPIAAAVAEAAKTPVERWREQDPMHEQVWQHLMERQDSAGGSGGFGNEFVDSLVRYLHKNGNLTPNQLAAITRQINREPQGPTVPVVTGDRVQITGRVVSATERHDRRFNKTTLKLTVADDRGFRVYGNAPRSLAAAMGGDRITFVATVTPSGRDEDFGFFSRARDARVLADD